MAVINTGQVQAVLTAWADNFVEDVPAVHTGGKYLIEYDALVEHLTNLDYDALVEIMLVAVDNYSE